MAQVPAGVRIHDNAGVHQNENVGVHQTTNNVGVHQNGNTHSPQNDHNDPWNDPTIRTKNTIDITGNESGAEDEDKNEAENEDKNEREELEEAPTKNSSADADRDDATDANIQTLCVIFLYAKNNALCVTFYIWNLSYSTDT